MDNTSQDQMAGGNTSIPTVNQTQIGITPVIYGTKGSGDYISSADQTFRRIVQEMIAFDKRFTGMASYVRTIAFYWSNQIETACAGHGFIFFNPNFWDQLDAEQQKTVVAHEIWHLILNHLDRGEGYDADSYNIAGDHVINLTLQEDGFKIDQDMEFGDIKPCCDPKYKGWSTERIYQDIYQQRKNGSGNDIPKPVAGTPSKDQIEDLIKSVLEHDPSADGKKLSQIIEDNQHNLDNALEANPGTDTGCESRLLEAARTKVFIQQATYEEIFSKYLTDPLSGGKRTYVRPSRRQRRGDLRLKGSYPKRGRHNRLTHLVYALDVSGSISTAEAKMFISSAKTLKEKLNPERMTIILWDTQIKFEKTFREDEKLDNIRVEAGGGTALEPVYRRVKTLNPEALVIFTDLEVGIPPEPDWETIWFVSGDVHDHYLQRATYGDVYQIPESIK